MTDLSTTNSFATYTEHLLSMHIQNPDLFLGFLAWYTVPESVWVDYEDYTARAMKFDAPVAVKQAPKAADVFLRACTTVEAQHKKIPTSTTDTYANFLIRKAGSDADWICKQIVVEYVDVDEHVLSFEVLGDLRFHKRTNEMIAKPTLAGVNNVEFEMMVDEVRAYFLAKEMLLTAYIIRETFRKAMEGPLKGLSVRSAGGIYFVGTSKGEELAKLERLAADIDGVSLHVLPLVDDGQQREMLRAAFEDDSVGELQKLMAEMAEKKKGKITDKQLVAFQVRYDELMERTKEYSSLLEDGLDTASASLELCKAHLTGLLEKAL